MMVTDTLITALLRKFLRVLVISRESLKGLKRRTLPEDFTSKIILKNTFFNNQIRI